jgi:hypothetical protein
MATAGIATARPIAVATSASAMAEREEMEANGIYEPDEDEEIEITE